MKTTFSQSELASDTSAAGTVRASREPMARSIWVVLAMAVLVAAPAASDAEPVPTCKAMCQRLTDCKSAGYTQRCLDTCKPHEGSEEGRAQIRAFTKYTCQQIMEASRFDRCVAVITSADRSLGRRRTFADDQSSLAR
jgi:hypothetical protein